MAKERSEIQIVSQNQYIFCPKGRSYFAMPQDEWSYLKEDIMSISKKSSVSWWCQVLGSLSLGAAIATTIQFFLEEIQRTQANSPPTNPFLCVLLMVVLYTIGILGLVIAWQRRTVDKKRAADAQRYIERIEKIYFFPNAVADEED